MRKPFEPLQLFRLERKRLAEHFKSDEKQPESHQRFADVFVEISFCEREKKSYSENRKGEIRYFKIESENRNNPSRDRCADVRAENYAGRLLEREKSCVHESYDHHGCRARRLDYHRDECAGEQSLEAVARHGGKRALEFFARALLHTVAHQFHSVQKERETSH